MKASARSAAARGSAPKDTRKGARQATRPELVASRLEALQLRPKIRDRLLELMGRCAIPPQARLAHLHAVTGRAPQCSRRWIDPQRPGLPDLEAFALLCLGFDMDANQFLGLAGARPSAQSQRASSMHGTSSKGPLQCGDADSWVAAIVGELSQNVQSCRPMRMSGDEMEPVLCDGDLIFVDADAQAVAGNGVYMLEAGGRTMVRFVECRIGAIVLSCANPRYEPCVIPDKSAHRKARLTVVGKVLGGVALRRFWRASQAPG